MKRENGRWNLSFFLLPLFHHLSGTLKKLLFSSPFSWSFFLFHLNLCPLKKKKKRYVIKPLLKNSIPKLNLDIPILGSWVCGCSDGNFVSVSSSLGSNVACVQELERFARIFQLLCCYDSGEDWAKTVTCGLLYQTMRWKMLKDSGQWRREEKSGVIHLGGSPLQAVF